MTTNHKIFFLVFMLVTAVVTGCKKDYGNLNSPTEEDFLKNPTKDQLNNLVTGVESAMRNNIGLYLDDVGVIGREMYRFSTGDPRYTTDLLGASDAHLDPTGFYLTNTWASRYRVVKNCNLLINASAISTFVSDAEAKGYAGFAKTMMAYQLLLNLNLTYNNGIRTEVANPDQPGPIENYDEALASIATLLDEANGDLSGAQVAFPLTSGFAGFNDAGGLSKVNRGIAARVAIYREQWQQALDALQASFFDLNGDFSTGVYHVFGTGSGDQLNPAFFPRNQAGDVRLAHPSYADDIENGDDRSSKAALRSEPQSYQGLSSNHDVWVYTTSTAPVPLVRNEELILIYAEANIQLENLSEGEDALNVIRNAHNLADYSGAGTKPALLTEMLNQRRFSLFDEGHRWVDVRRYGLLADLPVDRPDDDVWEQFPVPATEQ
ncbi:MAG: RagB/SusD family nutrient uptake outer membrane protein [Chitinophagaceae bacterium]|nr:RagB/SusD family nutrient uptake outer membrane protein [Chitinophagaceae bacterium]